MHIPSTSHFILTSVAVSNLNTSTKEEHDALATPFDTIRPPGNLRRHLCGEAGGPRSQHPHRVIAMCHSLLRVWISL